MKTTEQLKELFKVRVTRHPTFAELSALYVKRQMTVPGDCVSPKLSDYEDPIAHGDGPESTFGILPLGFHTQQSAYRDIFVFEKRLLQLMYANQAKLRMGEFILFSLSLTMFATLVSVLAPSAAYEYSATSQSSVNTEGDRNDLALSAFSYWLNAIVGHLGSLFLLMLQIPLFLSYIFSFNHLVSPFAVFLVSFLSMLSFVTTRSYFQLIVLPSRWHQGLNRTLRNYNMELSPQGTLLFTTRIPTEFVQGYEKYRQARQTEEIYGFLQEHARRRTFSSWLGQLFKKSAKRRGTRRRHLSTSNQSDSNRSSSSSLNGDATAACSNTPE